MKFAARLVLLALLAAAARSASVDVFVSTTGTDSPSSGSKTSPYLYAAPLRAHSVFLRAVSPISAYFVPFAFVSGPLDMRNFKFVRCHGRLPSTCGFWAARTTWPHRLTSRPQTLALQPRRSRILRFLDLGMSLSGVVLSRVARLFPSQCDLKRFSGGDKS